VARAEVTNIGISGGTLFWTRLYYNL